jgi:hypothetical protein
MATPERSNPSNSMPPATFPLPFHSAVDDPHTPIQTEVAEAFSINWGRFVENERPPRQSTHEVCPLMFKFWKQTRQPHGGRWG